MVIRCQHRLPGPEAAGYVSVEKLREAAEQAPHLRPCPRHRGTYGSWNWIDRKHCAKCPHRVEEEPEAQKSEQPGGENRAVQGDHARITIDSQR